MSRIRRLLAMGVLGGEADPVQYLLRDQFTTDDDAPMTSPRTCEPGPGTLTITDTGNELSISGAQLVKGNGTIYKLVGGAQARVPGLALYCRDRLDTNTGHSRIVFSTNGSAYTCGIVVTVGNILDVYDNTVASGLQILSLTAGIKTEYLVILRTTGAFVLARGGIGYGRWTLVGVGSLGTATPLYPVYYGSSVNSDGIQNEMSVVKLSGFDDDYALASSHIVSPTDPVSIVGTQKGYVEIVWTPEEGETLEVSFNRADDDNKNIIRCSQTGSTMILYKKVGGTETRLGGGDGSQTWTVGTPYRISALFGNGSIYCMVNSVWKYPCNTTSATENVRNTGVTVSGFTAAANFAFYPLLQTLPRPFDYSGNRWFLGVGDSKTAAYAYEKTLVDGLETASGVRWCYDVSAIGGQTVATTAAAIVGDLSVIASTPESVLINLGSNDASSLPAEITWKANYRTIIEAMHAKWPSAKIYLAKPVRLSGNPPSTPNAATATMHGYIDDLIAEYEYVYVGIDETALEGGDSYVTYLTDSTHPNAAGYIKVAELWQTILGY